VLPSNAKAVEACGPPPRRASNRHRKQGKGRMGNFANAAAQYDLDKRGDGHCVSGRWIALQRAPMGTHPPTERR
jgi:hypothetical protein